MQNNSHEIILNYQKSWQVKFELEKRLLEEKLSKHILEVEHIGSTSILGLSSKPIIDIAIVIPKYEDASKFKPLLEDLDYKALLPGNERDFYSKGDPIEFHLSICFADRGGFYSRQIAFRDYLRNHELERVEYDNLKRKLLENDPTGVNTYISGKTEFVNGVLRKAGWVEENYNEYIKNKMTREQIIPKTENIKIDFTKEIEINSDIFTLVKIQREGVSAIYRSSDGKRILRIGDTEKITKDLNNHKTLSLKNYSVAKILKEGQNGDLKYYLEESLGDHLFGEIFKKEYLENGEVSNESFNLLIDESKKLLQAQINDSSMEQNWESLFLGVHVDWIVEELPEYGDKILEKFESCKERLRKLPFVFSHGDYNPYNVFPNGIIDFEDGFFAPIVFDVFSLIVYAKHFPTKERIQLEINGAYEYSEAQKKSYIEEMDKILGLNGLPRSETFLGDIFFLKEIWLTLRMHKWPEMQKYRYKIFIDLLK